MKRLALTAAFSILVIVALSSVQAQMGPPTPAPELKKLDFLAGDWSAEGTQTSAPGAPSGKWSTTSRAEWMDGNFFLVEHSDMDLAAMGKGKELAFYGYDSDRGVYTYKSFSSWGEAENAEGKLDGDTWTWSSTEHMGGKTMQGRFTMKVLSPTSYTMKFEMSPDGKQWFTAMEGKATKK
jgi:hypothetical protein